jgi:Tfp pilus assembly protein PilN
VKRALGIEIGRAFAALCEIALEGEGAPRPEAYARHVFPEGELPGPEQLADTCLRLALESGVRQRSAVLALARSLTYTKTVQLPPLPTEDRLKLVSIQPERFFPVSDRPLVCDLEPGSNGGPSVAHATESEQLETVVEALQSRGFRIRAVIPASTALQRAALRGVPTLSESNWLLVRPEGGGLTAHAYQARSLRVSRRMENFGADPEAACREIARTVSCSFEDGATVSEVRWSGWSALPDAVRRAAATTLPVPVRDLSELPVGSEGLAAYGAALAGLEEAPRPDLMPPAVRARRRQQGRWITIACGALALLTLLAVIWSIGERQDRALHKIEAAIRQARTGADEALDARDQLGVLEGRIGAVQQRMEQRAAWLRLLNEISSALPRTAWIGNIAVEPTGEVSLSGYAATASSLIPALQATAALERVQFAAPATRVNIGQRELEAFNIRAVLQGSPADSAAASAGAAPQGTVENPDAGLSGENDEE